MKDLAIVIWACARIKMPKESQLPVILNEKATTLLLSCIENHFLFDWKISKRLQTELEEDLAENDEGELSKLEGIKENE